MRSCRLLMQVLLIAPLANTAMLRAQFQEPTADELKMTSDPKAPGAAAVYLYREETTDDDRHFHTYYARIKVLTEKGKELDTVRIPYERGESKVVHIEGRTIHADGTVIALTAKPDDVVDVKAKHYQVDTIVFTLPAVDVGSILEYRLQVRYNDDLVISPTWNLQQPYFVHKEHFMFHPAVPEGFFLRNDRGQMLDRLMWTGVRLPDGVTVQNSKNYYTLDVTDVPPIPDDDWMPPINGVSWKVSFFYTYALNRSAFWDYEGSQLAQVMNLVTQPTNTLKDAAAGIVSAGDSDDQKARKLYAAVMKLDNTDFSRVKSEAERKKEKLKEITSLDDVWKQKGGTGAQIAFLYAGLARAAGLKAYLMPVVDRDDAIFDIGNLTLKQFDDYIVRLVINGNDVYVDPAEKMCPFGTLLWTHTLTGGLRLADTDASLASTPASSYKDNVDQRTADLTLDADGNVAGVARILLTGADALRWRQLALRNDEEEVRKQFIDALRDDLPDGVEASFDHFIDLNDYESSMMAIVQISGHMGTATGKRYLLPGLFFQSRAKHPFIAQEKRATPIDVHYPRMERDEVVYSLPSGYTVESAPKLADVKWTGFAVLHSNSVTKEDSVEVDRVFARGFTYLAPEAYNDLHDFYLKLAEADQQQLVLLRPAAARGN
ncbi:MAG: DUF3857 domain-containing protein [Terracidiphilus sp.]